jgi:ATP-binding cassette, subfamily B, multidrug efflux pump
MVYIYFLIATSILAPMLSLLNNYSMQILGINTMYKLRNQIFKHLQKLSLNYYHKKRTGKIISYVTNDVDTVNQLISGGIINLIVDLFKLVGALILMIIMSPKMCIVLVIFIPLILVVNIFFSKKARLVFKKMREVISEMTGQTQEMMNGLRTIISHKTENHTIETYDQILQKEKEAREKTVLLWSKIIPVNESIMYISVGFTILFGGLLYIEGEISIGVVFGFVLYYMQFAQPLGALSQHFNNIQNSIVGGGRILDLLNHDPELKDKDSPNLLQSPKGEIEFSNVNFSYGDKDILHDFSLKIKPKERLAIVGPTGAGKTTIISLIPRFYDIQEGDVSIDGINVKDYQMQSLREGIGMVLQDNFLFADTIESNIKYGKLNSTDEEMIAIAKKIGAHHFISNLPRGYKTKIGERGAILSIGQKQLIAFARMLLADPPILILDEATSSVDAYSEILIQNALEELLSNRTSIIIAHRLSTIVKSNTIVVLKDGQIVEKGNHKDLLLKKGLYHNLYAMQFAENRLKE